MPISQRFTHLAVLLLFALPTITQAQTSDNRWMAGLSAIFLDYQGPMTGDFTRVRAFDPGISMGAFGYINPWLNASLTSSFVPETFYPLSSDQVIGTSLIDVHALARLKFNNGRILQEDALLAPYIGLGFGLNTASNNLRTYLPAALGLRIQVSKNFSIQWESLYKFPMGTDQFQHVSHSAGFVFALPSNDPRRPTSPKTEREPRNRPIASNALPDADNDGVPDRDDLCPDIKGKAMYLGCPEPDEQAKPEPEPQQPGTYDMAGNQEVSTPAKENVNNPNRVIIQDELASQPKEAFASNTQSEMSGSDIAFIEASVRNIYFESASDELTFPSYATLDSVAELLHKYPSYHLEVMGHTDNTGDQAANVVLSIKRAFKVKYYLVYEKGIKLARISSNGYSSVSPISDNSTEEGRRMNRRVEFRVVAPQDGTIILQSSRGQD